MTKLENFEQLDSWFAQALDMRPGQRESFIGEISVEHPKMAQELSRLLELSEKGAAYLGEDSIREHHDQLKATLATNPGATLPAGLSVGDTLGTYRLEKQIGQGVRSVVFLAVRQDQDWTQQVAIKFMTSGFNSDDVYRRFLNERQILTSLHHAHITTLLDGGITPTGTPYFVMEYIDGLDIISHCQQHQLELEERIRLFRQVCDALAYAHRHLVVHRDIKPTNILISAESGVQLLDFGIAKLLDPAFTQHDPAITQEFSKPMTPAYASPEQNAGGPITTATDVYQLGLLLSELITGLCPARKQLGIENGRLPVRLPSNLLDAEECDVPYPASDVRSDLDWIVLKALEPEPGQRYDSAADMLADTDRYLANQPVTARSPTLLYMARKFIRRRPGLAIASGLGLTMVVGYLGLMLYFNSQLERERAAALDAAQRAETVKNLLVTIITSPDPVQGSGIETRVSDILRQAEAMVTGELDAQPEIQTELLSVLADTYQGLSVPHKALELRHQEIAQRHHLGDLQSANMMQARRKLSETLLDTGDTTGALASYESLLEDLQARQPELWLELALVNIRIGSLHRHHGRRDDAHGYINAAVESLERNGGEPLALATAYSERGYLADEYSLAHDDLLKAWEIRRQNQGEDHPETLIALSLVAANLTNMDRMPESIEIYQTLVPKVQSTFGPLHTQTLTISNNRAFTLQRAGETDQAVVEHENLLELKTRKFGRQHREVANSLQNLGVIYSQMARYDVAISRLTEAAQIFSEVNLPGNFSTAYPHISLASIHGKLDQVEAMERHARQAIEYLEGNVASNNVALLKSQCLLGDALIRKGDASNGVPMVSASLDGMTGRERLGQAHFDECRAALDRANIQSP